MRKTRNYSELEKQQILAEVKSTGNVAAVARKNNMPPGTIHTWLEKKSPSKTGQKSTLDELKKVKSRNEDLELENKILKELLKKTYQVWDTD